MRDYSAPIYKESAINTQDPKGYGDVFTWPDSVCDKPINIFMANTACVNNCVSHHKTKLMATPYFLQIASPYAEKALQRVNILVTFKEYNF